MANDLWKSVLLTVATLAIVSINSMALVAVCHSKDLSKDRATPFLESLLIANLLQGALSTSVSAVLSWIDMQNMNNIIKRIHAFVLFFTPAATLTSVAALATAKMITIVWPLRVSNLLTKKRTVFILCFVWIIPLVYGVFQFFAVSPEYDYQSKTSWEGPRDMWITHTGVFAIFLPCFLLLSGSYITIFIVVIKQSIKIRKQTIPSGDNVILISNLILKAFKSAKSIIIVITIYILLYVVPSLSVFFITDNNIKYTFWLFWLPYSDSFWNCLFYLCFSKAAKNELRKIFHLNPVQDGNQ